MVHVHSHLLQEQKDTRQEVPKSLVIDQLLLDCLSDLHPLWLLHVLLVDCAVEGQLEMGYVLELRVIFVLRIDEVLNFSHLELPHPDESVSRGDFVTEAQSDLRRSEGQSSSVEL